MNLLPARAFALVDDYILSETPYASIHDELDGDGKCAIQILNATDKPVKR